MGLNLGKAKKLIEQLVRDAIGKVDDEALAESLLDEWCGVKGLAKAIKEECDEQKVGSVARASLLKAQVDLVCTVARANKKKKTFEGALNQTIMESVITALLDEQRSSEIADAGRTEVDDPGEDAEGLAETSEE